MKFFCLFFLFILLLFRVNAQACPDFPADCSSDEPQLPDSGTRLNNPVLPQEISMEIRLHDFFSGLIQAIADKMNWEVYEYEESAASGFLNANRTGPLEYKFRPPHEYEIAFVMIVNRDSLNAWKNWWSKDYMTQFVPENFSRMESIREAGKLRINAFRNASMLRVKLHVNGYLVRPSSIMENTKLAGRLNIPPASVSLMMHNNVQDEKAIFDLDQFNRCSDFAFLLFGKWNPGPDASNLYKALFSNDARNTDKVSVKAIPSDRVRNVAVHVEGSPGNIRSFLSLFDWQRMNLMISP